MIESNSNTTELESDVLYYFSQLSRDNQYRAIEYMIRLIEKQERDYISKSADIIPFAAHKSPL